MKTLGIIFVAMMTIFLSSQAPAQSSVASYKGSPKILTHMNLKQWEGYTRSAIDRAHKLYPLLDKDFRGNITRQEFLGMIQSIKDYYGEPITAVVGNNSDNGYRIANPKIVTSRLTTFLFVKPLTVLIERTCVLPLVYKDTSYAMGLIFTDEEGKQISTRISIQTLSYLLTILGSDTSRDFGKFLLKRIKDKIYLEPNIFQYGFFFKKSRENFSKDLAYFLNK